MFQKSTPYPLWIHNFRLRLWPVSQLCLVPRKVVGQVPISITIYHYCKGSYVYCVKVEETSSAFGVRPLPSILLKGVFWNHARRYLLLTISYSCLVENAAESPTTIDNSEAATKVETYERDPTESKTFDMKDIMSEITKTTDQLTITRLNSQGAASNVRYRQN